MKFSRGQMGGGMAGSIVAGSLGIMVLIIILFTVVLPQINTSVVLNTTQGGTSNLANLSGSGQSLALQTPLLIVLGFMFIPIVAVALSYFGNRQ